MEFSAAIIGSGRDLSRLTLLCSQSHVPASAILPVDSSAGSRAATVHRPRYPAPLTEDGGEDDGPFGGGGGGRGGRGWGFGGNGDSGWEEPEQRRRFTSSADPAFDVVYEVLFWIALSSCAHFALKRLSSLLAEREREMSIRGFAFLLFPESPDPVWVSVDVGCGGPRKHQREREFRETAARKWVSLLMEARGENQFRASRGKNFIQRNTQRFKVVQGDDPLRPPVDQQRHPLI